MISSDPILFKIFSGLKFLISKSETVFINMKIQKSPNHKPEIRTTVLSTSLGKTFFAWRFILNENILFWLTISNQKPFVFSVSVFCSQIFTVKLNLQPKIGLTYAIYSKVIFWSFCLRKYFLLFFAEFKLLIFHNNIVKISEKLNKQNLLKICLQVTYPTDFCKICIHFYYRKKWKYLNF